LILDVNRIQEIDLPSFPLHFYPVMYPLPDIDFSNF
jgi:hypothetical protein